MGKNRILVGFVTNGTGGGVDKYLLSFCKELGNREDIQIGLMTSQGSDALREELARYRVRLYSISSLRNPVRQYRQVCRIIKQDQYGTVYLNISTALNMAAAAAARRCHVKRVVLHSHSSGTDCRSVWKRTLLNGLHVLCRPLLSMCGNEYLACSKKAGLWMYPKGVVRSDAFRVIYNSIEEGPFLFDPVVRSQVREELGISDRFVIGHVGNFCYQKNQEFLIEVFEQIHKRRSDACLLLIGKGPDWQSVRDRVKEKGLEADVKFLGWRSDVHRLMQAMDSFLLPSRFEGLPIVGVEAQYARLTCMMSDRISKEVQITDKCYRLPLKMGAERWAEEVLRHAQDDRTRVRWKCGMREKYSHAYQIRQFLEIAEGASDSLSQI